MAVNIAGTLHIKSITGRNGAFSVGELVTEIGTFKIKDTVLDQYPAGAYQGDFLISQIFPSSYIAWGKVITEVRASLAALNIITEAAPSKRITDDAGEPDPMLETPVPSVPEVRKQANEVAADKPEVVASSEESATPHKPAKEKAEPSAVAHADSTTADFALFGAEIMQAVWERNPVKLDPTVDRQLFRAQRDRLGRKGLGWEFDPKTQTWLPPAA